MFDKVGMNYRHASLANKTTLNYWDKYLIRINLLIQFILYNLSYVHTHRCTSSRLHNALNNMAQIMAETFTMSPQLIQSGTWGYCWRVQ